MPPPLVRIKRTLLHKSWIGNGIDLCFLTFSNADVQFFYFELWTLSHLTFIQLKLNCTPQFGCRENNYGYGKPLRFVDYQLKPQEC